MAGLQSEIYSAIAITLTVALVALVLRMMARRITKQPLWYDDGFAVVALVSPDITCLHSISSRIDIRAQKMFAVTYCIIVVIGRPPISWNYRPIYIGWHSVHNDI